MKYHKIKGVPLDVCTAESKIAYNLAFANKDFIKGLIQSGKIYCWPQANHKLIDLYKNGYSYKPNKYDIDAIFCCLNAGLEEYIKRPFIASTYEEIGNCFKSLYL